jgi:hypothetical protein
MGILYGLGGAATFAFWVFLFVIGVLWIVLPFAIFGTKKLLRRQIDLQIENNQKLDALLVAMRPMVPAQGTPVISNVDARLARTANPAPPAPLVVNEVWDERDRRP